MAMSWLRHVLCVRYPTSSTEARTARAARPTGSAPPAVGRPERHPARDGVDLAHRDLRTPPSRDPGPAGPLRRTARNVQPPLRRSTRSRWTSASRESTWTGGDKAPVGRQRLASTRASSAALGRRRAMGRHGRDPWSARPCQCPSAAGACAVRTRGRRRRPGAGAEPAGGEGGAQGACAGRSARPTGGMGLPCRDRARGHVGGGCVWAALGASG